VGPRHLGHLVVALLGDVCCCLGVPVVLVEAVGGRDELDVHAHPVHLLDAAFRVPPVLGVVQLAVLRGHPVPVSAREDGPLKPLRCNVRVNIDYRAAPGHGCPPSNPVSINIPISPYGWGAQVYMAEAGHQTFLHAES
jgi:hypothetical protein